MEASRVEATGDQFVDDRGGGVPRGTRIAVYLFLVAFCVAGLVGIELWPLTGWRLFSQPREAHSISWQAVTLDGSGSESPIPFGRFSRGYWGSRHVLTGFAALQPAQQAAVCTTWGRALAELGVGYETIRIYRVDVDHSIRQDNRRAGPVDRTLRFECRDGVARTIGGES